MLHAPAAPRSRPGSPRGPTRRRGRGPVASSWKQRRARDRHDRGPARDRAPARSSSSPIDCAAGARTVRGRARRRAPGSTACGPSARRPRQQLAEVARASEPARDRRGRDPAAARAGGRDRCGATSTASPTSRSPRRAPEVADGTTLAGAGPRARTRAAAHGPDQSARARRSTRRCVERHEFLQQQLDDVRNTRRELARVIKAVDEEIVIVFESAFADVAATLLRAVRDAVPGRFGAARAHRPDDLLEHRHRDGSAARRARRCAGSRCCRAASDR